MVVIADSVMIFFRTTANDAAFNACTVDIATSETRGRVEGVLNLSLFPGLDDFHGSGGEF